MLLPIRSGPKLPQEPVFRHPPQWIHESVAAKCFLTPDKAAKARKPQCFPGVIRKGARS